jgi:hypothetical protein
VNCRPPSTDGGRFFWGTSAISNTSCNDCGVEVVLLIGLALVLLVMASSALSQAQKDRQGRKREVERQLKRAEEERARLRVIAESAEALAAERLRLRGTGKVPVVDWDQSFLESHSIKFRRPSVPRARPSGWNSEWDARQLLRQEGCCFWCGEHLNGLAHRDHIAPLARGGRNDISNLVMACPPCNLDKSASDPREWIWRTSRIPESRRAVLDSLIPGAQIAEQVPNTPHLVAEENLSVPVEFDIVDLDRRLFGD